jgi:hypothetical protein
MEAKLLQAEAERIKAKIEKVVLSPQFLKASPLRTEIEKFVIP